MLFLQEKLHGSIAPQKLCRIVVFLEIPRKLTCGSFFCRFIFVVFQDPNFILTGFHHGDLFERFKEDNLAKVSFLKLLTKENLLGCFH